MSRQDRVIQRMYANYRKDWRARTGCAMLTDDYYLEGREDVVRFWDLGTPPYRQTESPVEWLNVWVGNTVDQLTNLQTPTEYLEQIRVGPFVIWNDARCTSRQHAPLNTAATMLQMAEEVPHGKIYGPVLVTESDFDPRLDAYPPLPLSPQALGVLTGWEAAVRNCLDQFGTEVA